MLLSSPTDQHIAIITDSLFSIQTLHTEPCGKDRNQTWMLESIEYLSRFKSSEYHSGTGTLGYPWKWACQWVGGYRRHAWDYGPWAVPSYLLIRREVALHKTWYKNQICCETNQRENFYPPEKHQKTSVIPYSQHDHRPWPIQRPSCPHEAYWWTKLSKVWCKYWLKHSLYFWLYLLQKNKKKISWRFESGS